jgi:hypothetical protein
MFATHVLQKFLRDLNLCSLWVKTLLLFLQYFVPRDLKPCSSYFKILFLFILVILFHFSMVHFFVPPQISFIFWKLNFGFHLV